MDLDAQIGARMQEERKRLGLSQQAAADAAGIRREMWARYEAGAEPGAKVLAAIAAAGADVLYILTGQVSEAALMPDEAMLVQMFRAASPAAKGAALGALVGAQQSPGQVMRNVGSGNIQAGGNVTAAAVRKRATKPR